MNPINFISIVLFLIFFIVIGFLIFFPQADFSLPGTEKPKTVCSNESRNVNICTEEYNPVCGYFSKTLSCAIKRCSQTYSNSCFACKDARVNHWMKSSCAS